MPVWIRDEDMPDWQGPQPLIRPALPAPATAESEPETTAEIGPAEADLEAWLAAGTRPIEQLRKLCLQRGLSAAGDRAVLVARLRAALAAPAPEAQP